MARIDKKPHQPEIIMMKLNELKENPKWVRKHSKKKIEKLAKWIIKTNYIVPIVLDDENQIASGYCRFLAARKLCLELIPTVRLGHLSKDELRLFAIAENQLVLDAEWDVEILKVELTELSKLEFDQDLFVFEPAQMDMIILEPNKKQTEEELNKADELPDESKIIKRVKFGDIWRLGNHYLICGDSLKDETLKALLGDLKANMIFTDAPYNVKVDGHICGKGKIKHDEFQMASGEMSNDEFTKFLRTSMQLLVKYSTDGSIHFQCMDWRHAKNMLDAAESIYTELKNICVWDKGSGGMGSMYRSQFELIFVFKSGKSKHCNNVQLGKFGRNRTNIWSYPGVRASNPNSIEELKLHPTVKNVQMVADAILDCSNPNDIILDAFGGSGTTLLAAEKTNRRAYLVEIDHHYCDTVIYRFNQISSKTVEFVTNIQGDQNV